MHIQHLDGLFAVFEKEDRVGNDEDILFIINHPGTCRCSSKSLFVHSLSP